MRLNIEACKCSYDFLQKCSGDIALYERMKYENASNELIRRVPNTCKNMDVYEIENLRVTNAFMETLKISVYVEGFRKQIALSAFRGGKKMDEREEEGIHNVYRLQTEGAAQRHKDKTSDKTECLRIRKKMRASLWK